VYLIPQRSFSGLCQKEVKDLSHTSNRNRDAGAAGPVGWRALMR
jgi:hypothetical protein